MAFELEVDVARKRITVRLSGHITAADLEGADSELRARPEIRPDFDQLVDTDAAIRIDLPNESIVALAGRPPYFEPASRRAFVARSDLGWGLARMFELRRADEAGEIRVFRSRGEAIAWLEGKRAVPAENA